MIVKPFLKWVGGKTQIIDKLLENYPTKMNNYHDIFLGGGSTLLALLSCVQQKKITVLNKIYAYDINSTLIHVHKNIRNKLSFIFVFSSKVLPNIFVFIPPAPTSLFSLVYLFTVLHIHDNVL